MLKKIMEHWKFPSILLFGIGISNIGDWIYLIALNLMILDKTGSQLAVALLYIIRPLASIVTNFWAGSIIDRINKRKLMITLDGLRALLIAGIALLLPLNISMGYIYILVFIVNMASSVFAPTSSTYISKLISPDQRKRFNSIYSLVTSGAFLIGPAVAGVLFLIGTPVTAVYITALALLISGIVTSFMPNVEKQAAADTKAARISLQMLREDWKLVFRFGKQQSYTILILALFGVVFVIATAVDSLEAAFSKQILLLSNEEYGFLVSIAGAGIICGALINTIIVKRIAISMLIGAGSIFVAIGYIIYAFSSSFIVAAVGFFILAFFLSFANTGFQTFYQNNIPSDIMGRVGSLNGLFQSIIAAIITIVFGYASQIISIQYVVIFGVLVMFIVSIILCVYCLQPSKNRMYGKEFSQ